MKKVNIKSLIIKVWRFVSNPRFLLCFGIAWLITNGWSYILFGVGTYFEIPWMIAVASAYLAFLWLPISPEKIVTVAIAMVLLKHLFPGDTKTLGVLRELHEKAKSTIKRKKKEHKEKKEEHRTESGDAAQEMLDVTGAAEQGKDPDGDT